MPLDPCLPPVWAALDGSERFRPASTPNILRSPAQGQGRAGPRPNEKRRPPGMFATPPPPGGAGTHTYPFPRVMQFPGTGPLWS